MAGSAFQTFVKTLNSNPSQDGSEPTHQSEESHWDLIENMDKPRICDNVYVQNDFKLKLPKFSGQPNMLEPFLMQIQLISRHYRWSEQQFREQLIFSLHGEALKFVSYFPLDLLDNTDKLLELLYHRFGECSIPEVYRAKLHQLEKHQSETIQEYSGRISQLMSRAYPDIQGTKIYENIAVQHMLRGLSDQHLAYEVFVQKPINLIQAVEMINWQEMCRSFAHNSSCDSKMNSGDTTGTTSIPQKFSQSNDKQSSVSPHKNRLNSAEEPIQRTQSNICHIKLRKSKCYRCRRRGHRAELCPNLQTDQLLDQLSHQN